MNKTELTASCDRNRFDNIDKSHEPTTTNCTKTQGPTEAYTVYKNYEAKKRANFKQGLSFLNSISIKIIACAMDCTRGCNKARGGEGGPEFLDCIGAQNACLPLPEQHVEAVTKK